MSFARPEPLPDPPAIETLTRAERETWAELMRVAFQLDVLMCPRCGGRMRHLATILDVEVAKNGFARFQCGSCGHDHLVALSCKTRGLCPSCAGRRMTALTRHIMDAELPHVPIRQWVRSLPHPLRYRAAYDHELCTALHRILSSALKRRLRRLARARGHKEVQTGSLTFVQRFGGGLNLNVHYHLIGLDGWWSPLKLMTSQRAPAESVH